MTKLSLVHTERVASPRVYARQSDHIWPLYAYYLTRVDALGVNGAL